MDFIDEYDASPYHAMAFCFRMTESYKQGTYNVISAYFSDNGRDIRDADGKSDVMQVIS